MQRTNAVKPTMFLGVPRVWEKLAEKLKAIGAATKVCSRQHSPCCACTTFFFWFPSLSPLPSLCECDIVSTRLFVVWKWNHETVLSL